MAVAGGYGGCGTNTPESRRQELANAETILSDAKENLPVAQNMPASLEQAKNPANDDSKVHINPLLKMSKSGRLP
ncbi:hypothetical protein AGMMS49925_12390 [Deltaproteobacteria bacterium]|nr:hypothetical protein AGMMS49925_12390 [Deltaproteobacteria bacterium]